MVSYREFSSHKRDEISLMKRLVNQLKQLLAQHQLWQTTPPSAQALSSTEPFAIDTLEPHEWLQWIFIQRIEAMIEAKQSLPKGFEIAPYFQQVWQERREYDEIVALLRLIDDSAKR